MIHLMLHQFGKIGFETLEDMSMTIDVQAFERNGFATRDRYFPSRDAETAPKRSHPNAR